MCHMQAEFTADTTEDFESMACITAVMTWDIKCETATGPEVKYVDYFHGRMEV